MSLPLKFTKPIPLIFFNNDILSTRPDLVRQDWLTELTNLQLSLIHI